MSEIDKTHLKNLIGKLEERLKEIYTIDVPEEYPSYRSKTFDLREELKNLRLYESLYSPLETNGVPEGAIYEEYIGYLKKVREAKGIVEQEKERIEEENRSEITNANVLLKRMIEELEKHPN